jgi:hypothetical protein
VEYVPLAEDPDETLAQLPLSIHEPVHQYVVGLKKRRL